MKRNTRRTENRNVMGEKSRAGRNLEDRIVQAEMGRILIARGSGGV